MVKTAELIKETITVTQSGQWGPKVGNEYYGLNDPLTATDFKAGGTYDVLINQGKPTPKYPSGKKYICQIVGSIETKGQVGTPVYPFQSQGTTSSGRGQGMEKTIDVAKDAYWDKKNMDMRLGGLFHDAAQITASLVAVQGLTVVDALKTFDEVLTGVIASRERLG